MAQTTIATRIQRMVPKIRRSERHAMGTMRISAQRGYGPAMVEPSYAPRLPSLKWNYAMESITTAIRLRLTVPMSKASVAFATERMMTSAKEVSSCVLPESSHATIQSTPLLTRAMARTTTVTPIRPMDPAIWGLTSSATATI